MSRKVKLITLMMIFALMSVSVLVYAESVAAAPPEFTFIAERPAPEPLVIILVEFDDVKFDEAEYQTKYGKTPEQYWSDKVFGVGTGSVNDFFKENSGGEYSFDHQTLPSLCPVVPGADGTYKVTVPRAHPNTTNTTDEISITSLPPIAYEPASSEPIGDTIRLALRRLQFRHPSIPSAFFAFVSTYSSSFSISNPETKLISPPNGLHILFVVAGAENASDGNVGIPKVQAHKGRLNDNAGAASESFTATAVAGIYNYAMIGEKHADGLATIGVIAHVLGHNIGAPELYDYDSSFAQSHPGYYSVMAEGLWGTNGGQDGDSPTHFDPWVKNQFGWHDFVEDIPDRLYPASDSGNYNILKIDSPDPYQYFLIENRQKQGFDEGFGSDVTEGIVVWHIDEWVMGNRTSNFGANDYIRPGITIIPKTDEYEGAYQEDDEFFLTHHTAQNTPAVDLTDAGKEAYPRAYRVVEGSGGLTIRQMGEFKDATNLSAAGVTLNFTSASTGKDSDFAYDIYASLDPNEVADLAAMAGTPIGTVTGNGAAEEYSYTLKFNGAAVFSVGDKVYYNIVVDAGAGIFPAGTVGGKAIYESSYVTVPPPTIITSAAISVTVPVRDAVPNTTANGTGDFTWGTVAWEPTDNPFKGNVEYTATVTLTAKDGFTFTGLETATINGEAETSIKDNIGTDVTLSYKFPATEPEDEYGISLSVIGTHTFDAKEEGYALVSPQSITVENTGNRVTGDLDVKLSGDDGGSFTLSTNTLSSIAVGGNGTFTVKPNNGLTKDTYNAKVTVSGGNGITASFDVSFEVKEKTVPDIYKISISGLNEDGAHTFDAEEEGYDPVSALTVTVNNTGNRETGPLGVVLSGINKDDFALSNVPLSSIDVGKSDTFTVEPKVGLLKDTYTATVTVSGGNGITAPFNVSFTVNEKDDPGHGDDTPIKTAGISVTAPVRSIAPNTTATDTGDTDKFSLSAVTWEPTDNPFKGNVRYTASVKLTANSGYTFTGLTSATINGQTATVMNNVGTSVTLSYLFPPTEAEPPPADDYGISLSVSGTHTFAQKEEGYSPVPALAVTVNNTGDRATGGLNVALSGDDGGSFTLSTNTLSSIAVSGNGTFTVKPNDDLSDGTYTATVTVSGGNGITASFVVTFTVSKIVVPDPADITITVPSFSAVITGYARPAASSLTITNKGSSAASITSVTVAPETAFEIAGGGTAIPAGGSINTWTIQPRSGLSQGTYNATVTVTYDGGKTASGAASFVVGNATVNPQYYTLTVLAGRGGRIISDESRSYQSGERISITARADSGYVFDYWSSSNGGSFSNSSRADTTFTMPSNSTTVTAYFYRTDQYDYDAYVSPESATFNINTGRDLDVRLYPGDYTLRRIRNGSYTLVRGTDYSVSGNSYTIAARYLNRLSLGTHNLTFEMSGGRNPWLSVTVEDSTRTAATSQTQTTPAWTSPTQISPVPDFAATPAPVPVPQTQTIVPQANYTTLQVAVNGAMVSFSGQQPVIKEGRSFIPVGELFQHLGYTVTWNADTGAATLRKGTLTIVVTSNSHTFTVNGRSYSHGDQPAQVINGKLMVPFVEIMKSIGCSAYRDSNNIIHMTVN